MATLEKPLVIQRLDNGNWGVIVNRITRKDGTVSGLFVQVRDEDTNEKAYASLTRDQVLQMLAVLDGEG